MRVKPGEQDDATGVPARGRRDEIARRLRQADLIRAILDATQDAIVAVDVEHRIVEANPAVETLFGHTRDELIGQDFSRLLPPELAAAHRSHLVNAATGGPTRYVQHAREVTAVDASGRRFPVSVALDELTVDGQKLYVGVMRDVTAEVAQREELVLRRDELDIQARVNRVVLHASRVDDLLDGVLKALVELRWFDIDGRAGAFLADEKRRVLKLASTVGEFDPVFIAQEREVPYGACLCGTAAVDRQVIMSDDCHTDPRRNGRFSVLNPHGHYIIPLVTEEELIGVIFLYTDRNPAWDDRRRELFETLGITVGSAIRRLTVEADLRASRKALLHLATHDPLTGCANRRLALDRLSAELSRCSRSGGAMSIVILDIDHFKRINDTHGHLAGDAVLREAAQRLSTCIRDYDVCGRFGGEEFIVVLPGSGLAEGTATAERLRGSLARTPVAYGEVAVEVRASCGVASCRGGASAEQLLRAADAALYRAKRAGRDRVEVASEIL